MGFQCEYQDTAGQTRLVGWLVTLYSEHDHLKWEASTHVSSRLVICPLRVGDCEFGNCFAEAASAKRGQVSDVKQFLVPK